MYAYPSRPVLGQVMARGFPVAGGAIKPTDPKAQETMKYLWEIADRPGVPSWERLHVKAMDHWAKG